jgi:hypothetical protein
VQISKCYLKQKTLPSFCTIRLSLDNLQDCQCDTFFDHLLLLQNSRPAKNTAWTLEIGTISSELQFTKQTRQVPSFQLSLQLGTHMYWLHSPNPQVPSCIIFLGTLLLCLLLCSEHCFFACFCARNTASSPDCMLCYMPASMLCSERCFLLFSAWNIASLPASVLGTLLLCSAICLLLCSARNPASLPASLLGTLLLCLLLCSEHCFFA